jgi:hypothetical protein
VSYRQSHGQCLSDRCCGLRNGGEPGVFAEAEEQSRCHGRVAFPKYGRNRVTCCLSDDGTEKQQLDAVARTLAIVAKFGDCAE